MSPFRSLVWLVLLPLPAPAAPPPNVILIVTDDQGYGDLGVHGNTMVRTPHLDALHNESVRFTDFHVDPTCSPTRAALMTGRYSTRTGVWHTIMGRSILFRDEVTLGDVFQANGYRTGIFGKWHLGDNPPSRPQDHGFSQVVIHGGGGIGQTPDYWGNDCQDDHYQVDGEWRPFEGYCTDVFFREAQKFIEGAGENPFFVYLPTNVPHAPYHVPERYRAYYAERGVPDPMASFYGMIENLDENVGQLVAWLAATGRDRDTVLIFMSDNGTGAGVPSSGKPAAVAAAAPAAWPGFNAGMRGRKGSVFEGGHRVPFFIRWPAGALGGPGRGRDVTTLAAHLDVLPTLVELCGLDFTPSNPLDGRSLGPLLGASSSPSAWPERTLFVHQQRKEIPPKWSSSGIMTQQWRLLNGRALFDITADPGQDQNVAADHPDVVARLRVAYEGWWSTLEPSLERYGYIEVGHPGGKPAELTCMDWHAPQPQIPWNQPLIEEMPVANGWWMLDVIRSGTYAVTLRAKPAEEGFPLPADSARVQFGDVEAVTSVPVGATAVTLALDLPAGPARFQSFLTDQTRHEERGAFFVTFERLPD